MVVESGVSRVWIPTKALVGGIEVKVEELPPVSHRWVGHGKILEWQRLGEEAPVGAHDLAVREGEAVGQKDAASGTLSEASDEAPPSIRGQGARVVVIRLVRKNADRGPRGGGFEDPPARGGHVRPWTAPSGQVRWTPRAEGVSDACRWGAGDGSREFDGEKGWVAPGPGMSPLRLSLWSMGEAEARGEPEASAMEKSERADRESESLPGRGESGESGVVEESWPSGTSGSGVNRCVVAAAGVGAVAGWVGAINGAASGGAAVASDLRCRRSLELG